MKEILKKWILFAEADLDAAKRLFQSPKPTQWTFLLILWHCHQTIEKGLKMIIIKRGKEIMKTHDLPKLSQISDIAFSEEQKLFLEDLNTFYLRPRYPDIIYTPLPKPNKEFVKNYLEKTDKLFIWLQKQ